MISKATLLAKGMKIASRHPGSKKPTVAKDFPKGMEIFAESMAKKFVLYVAERIKHNYKIPMLGIEVTRGELLRSIEQEESIVTISGGSVKEYKYHEIWRYFEYGRMDWGVIPDPIIKKIFIEFKEIYEQELTNHLAEKRNSTKK